MAVLMERAQSHLVIISRALLAAAWHPEDQCWGVRNIGFLAPGSFSRTGKLLTNSWTSSGYTVYTPLGTVEGGFLLGQHLQQHSQHLQPLSCPPQKARLCMEVGLRPQPAPLALINPEHFQEPRRERLGRKLQAYPEATQLERIPVTSQLSFSLSALFSFK